VLEKLVNISAAIRERSAIDKASGRTAKAEAWQTSYRTHDPGIRLSDGYEELDDDWQQYVEGRYGEWFDRQGNAILLLPGGGGDLADFIKLFDRVRGQGFARLEFRACRIGTDDDALKTIAARSHVRIDQAAADHGRQDVSRGRHALRPRELHKPRRVPDRRDLLVATHCLSEDFRAEHDHRGRGREHSRGGRQIRLPTPPSGSRRGNR